MAKGLAAGLEFEREGVDRGGVDLSRLIGAQPRHVLRRGCNGVVGVGAFRRRLDAQGVEVEERSPPQRGRGRKRALKPLVAEVAAAVSAQQPLHDVGRTGGARRDQQYRRGHEGGADRPARVQGKAGVLGIETRRLRDRQARPAVRAPDGAQQQRLHVSLYGRRGRGLGSRLFDSHAAESPLCGFRSTLSPWRMQNRRRPRGFPAQGKGEASADPVWMIAPSSPRRRSAVSLPVA